MKKIRIFAAKWTTVSLIVISIFILTLNLYGFRIPPSISQRYELNLSGIELNILPVGLICVSLFIIYWSLFFIKLLKSDDKEIEKEVGKKTKDNILDLFLKKFERVYIAFLKEILLFAISFIVYLFTEWKFTVILLCIHLIIMFCIAVHEVLMQLNSPEFWHDLKNEIVLKDTTRSDLPEAIIKEIRGIKKLKKIERLRSLRLKN